MFIALRTPSTDPGQLGVFSGATDDGRPWAVVQLGDSLDLHLCSPAECDALIAAAVEAKRLLDPPAVTA